MREHSRARGWVMRASFYSAVPYLPSPMASRPACHRLWQAGPLAGRLLARGGGLGLGGSHRILAVCPPSVAGVASTSAKAELRAYSRVHRVFERVGCETPVQHRTISGFQSLLPVARRTAAHALSVKSLLCRGFAAMVPRLAIESPPICD